MLISNLYYIFKCIHFITTNFLVNTFSKTRTTFNFKPLIFFTHILLTYLILGIKNACKLAYAYTIIFSLFFNKNLGNFWVIYAKKYPFGALILSKCKNRCIPLLSGLQRFLFLKWLLLLDSNQRPIG